MTSRYLRQEMLPGFGAGGQAALAGARTVIFGLGGLGCPAALYLASAGMGTLRLVDSDHVSETNLARQVLYRPSDVGAPKVDVAAAALHGVAPECRLEARGERATSHTAALLMDACDVVVDATDNFESRLAIADAAAELAIPVVWGAVQGYDGQYGVFDPMVTLRALVPDAPDIALDSCEGGAVLGTVCGVIGSAMATEAVKLVTAVAEPRVGIVNVYEGRSGRWSEVPVRTPHG